MALTKTLYNVFFRRTSTFFVTVLVGAFVFERVFDYGTDRFWNGKNKGVRWQPVIQPCIYICLFKMFSFRNYGKTSKMKQKEPRKIEIELQLFNITYICYLFLHTLDPFDDGYYIIYQANVNVCTVVMIVVHITLLIIKCYVEYPLAVVYIYNVLSHQVIYHYLAIRIQVIYQRHGLICYLFPPQLSLGHC